MRLVLSAFALSVLAACSGSDSTGAANAGGTVVIAVPADPDLLMPQLTNTTQGRMVADQIYERLVELPPNGPGAGDAGYEPRLAERWEWAPDSMSIAFHLNPKATWHDGRPVRASDVAFSFGMAKDSTSGSTVVSSLENVDSVTVRDSMTAVVWFARRSPSQFFEATYQVFVLPEHLLKDVPLAQLRSAPLGRKPVGTGRFRLASWEANQRLELVADTTNYRGRPALDRVIVVVAPDYSGALAKVLSGEADFLELVRPPNVPEVGAKPDLRLLKYPNLQFAFMLFNQRAPKSARPHPLFADAGVRRAIAMSLDRKAMVTNVLDSLGMVGIGPAPRAIATADSTVRHPEYNVAAARALLDSLGWRMGADSVRRKNGRAFEFTLMTPTSSQSRVRMAVLIQEALRQVGAKVNVDQVDFNAQSQRVRERDFDAVMNVIGTDPMPDAILQSWGTAGITGGQNYGSYSNPAFDALVDSGARSGDPAKSRELFRRAYQILADDVPAVWLYEPVLMAVKHRRITIPHMRVDAWWAGLSDWSIPAAERIERDRIGLRQAAQ